MADRDATLKMVQRAAEYVPDELRPSGRLEKIGWTKSNPAYAFTPYYVPAIAERDYGNDPLGGSFGASGDFYNALYDVVFNMFGKDKKKKNFKTEVSTPDKYNVNPESNRFNYVAEEY